MSQAKTKELKKAKKAVKKYVALLRSEDFPVDRAYIFGSYARGNFKKESDIDVCIVSPRLSKNWDKNESYLWQLTRKIDARIEPVGYGPEDFKTSAILSRGIKKNGVRVV